MKKSLVQTIVEGDHVIGQVSDPRDLMLAQDFAHDHVNGVTHDFVNNSNDPEISGFDYSLGAGNAFNMQVLTPGRIYTSNGISYDLNANATVTFDAADADLPRLDIVVARIEDEVNAELDLIPFTRLRTADEFAANTVPYPPSNINAATQLHWRSVVAIIKGTPSAQPVRPELASNEIPLYQVSIGAGMTRIETSNVLDLRNSIETLRRLNGLFDQLGVDLASLGDRVSRVEDLGGQPVDLGPVYGEIRSLAEILADLQRQITPSRDLPEIYYPIPKYLPTDIRSSQILATGDLLGSGHPVLDIEVGARINFGDADVAVTPDGFVDPNVNARYVTVGSGGSAHVKREQAINMTTITPLGSDGTVGFLGKNSSLTPTRFYPGVAARDSQYVEVFGGTSSDNATGLNDWHTYDTVNDTITPRTLTGDALPSSDRPALFPMGDGENVLVVAGRRDTNTPRCFVVNCAGANLVSTEIVTTKPNGTAFYGDLIADGKIFMLGVPYNNVGATTYWEYDVTSNTFTSLGVTGSIPTALMDGASGCYYNENEFVLLCSGPGLSSAEDVSVFLKTYIFNRTTNQWTRLNINSPFDYLKAKLQKSSFRLANINGRATMIGGFLNFNAAASASSIAYELGYTVPLPSLDSPSGFERPSVLAWNLSEVNAPPREAHGFCSTLGTDNLPDAGGYIFGGYGKNLNAQNQIYGTVKAGLIAATYNGVVGVSLGQSSSYAQFELPALTADWDVAAYLANLSGSFNSSNIKMEVSLDNGAHWHTIAPNHTFLVTDSANPGERRLRITLYRSPTSPPILTGLTEFLDEDGGDEIESRVVIRTDRLPGGDDFLYIDREGNLTFEAEGTPSTPDKCLILVADYDPDSSPGSTSYINRRRPVYREPPPAGDGQSGPTINVVCKLAVPVRYYEARGIKAGTKEKYQAGVTSENFFHNAVSLTGIASGDGYEIVFYG